MILVNQARFDATGACTETRDGRAVTFNARNRFTIVDNGEGNRPAADIVAVTAIGERGVTAAGGTIGGGNFQVRAQQMPSVDDLPLAAMRTLRDNSSVRPQRRLDHGFPQSVMTQLQR